MRHGYLTEMEKQWLYWRKAARRWAERAKPGISTKAGMLQDPLGQ